ncbi:hypothetical protein KC845_02810 [Candidatus Kaiserbacteria bacterium]|nr:hypothetical protein [Candidatus Kaiserbacteria bacterium]
MNKQEMKFWARMFENTPNMPPELMQGWIDNPKALKKILSGLVPTETHLTSLTSLSVASNIANPYDFFKTSEGLSTSLGFDLNLLSQATRGRVLLKTIIGYADLVQVASDAEVGSELPEDYVFEDVDTYLAHLATLIRGQLDGKSGVLLNNANANIFYVRVNGEVFVVSIRWSIRENMWQCRMSHLNTGVWGVGNRVFSATAA